MSSNESHPFWEDEEEPSSSSEVPDREKEPADKECSLATAGTETSATADRPASKSTTSLANGFTTYAIIYAFALGISLFLIRQNAGIFPAIPVAGISLGTLFLVAAWSVFGPGSYFQRLGAAHLTGTIAALGILLATAIIVLLETPQDFADEFFSAAVVITLGVIPVSVGFQAVFWIFRGLLGWQFLLRGESLAPSFVLKDIFLMMFLIALAFTAANISASVSMRYVAPVQTTQYQPRLESDGRQIYDADGQPIYDEITLSVDEFSQAKRERSLANRQSYLIGYVIVFCVSVIIALLSLPVLAFLFFNKDPEPGCGFLALYISGLSAIPIMAALVLSGGPGGYFAVQASLTFFACLGAYALAIWLPLATARDKGLTLTTRKRFEESSKPM